MRAVKFKRVVVKIHKLRVEDGVFLRNTNVHIRGRVGSFYFGIVRKVTLSGLVQNKHYECVQAFNCCCTRSKEKGEETYALALHVALNIERANCLDMKISNAPILHENPQ